MSDVVTGEAVVVDVRAARLPTRAVAVLLDILVQLAVMLPLMFLGGMAAKFVDPALATAIALVLNVGVIVGYPTACESLWRGRSLGKLALGLRVVSDDGGPERFRQALLRALAALFEIWLLTGMIAVIASLLSERGRRLGDVFAGTLVVQERFPKDRGEQVIMPPGLQAWANGLELARLPDNVALTARQYVSRYSELAPEAREQMGQRIATAVAAHVSPPPPSQTPPVTYLAAVLAERRRREHERLTAQQAGPYGAAGYVASPGQTGPSGSGHAWPEPDGRAGRQDVTAPGAETPAGGTRPGAEAPDPPPSGGFVPPA